MISTKLMCVYIYIYDYICKSISPSSSGGKLEPSTGCSVPPGLWISTHPPLSVQEIGGPPCLATCF